MAKTKSVKNNPNGANQWIADPRQQLFLAYYLDPKSLTFSNAYQSALKAGYEDEYAKVIMSKMPTWLSEKVNDLKSSDMLEKAERNLVEMMDLPSMTHAMGAFGPLYDGKGDDKKPVMAYATGLLKIKNDASKFVAEKIGRGKYAKEDDDKPKGTVTNFTQIIINPPHGAKNVRDQSN